MTPLLPPLDGGEKRGVKADSRPSLPCLVFPAADAVATAKSTKSAKAAFAIDFASPESITPRDKLFEAPSGKTSISLPATARTSTVGTIPTGKKILGGKKASRSSKEKKAEVDRWLLPDDLHFSSTQLLRLFMKKTFTVRSAS